MNATCEVLGVGFFSGDVDSAARLLINRAQSGKGGYVCLANVHVLMTAQRDPAVMRALGESWINFPDGMPVAWMQRRAGAPNAKRIAGADLLGRVASLGQTQSLRHYFFGSTPEVVSALHARLREAFPAIETVGIESPAVVARLDFREISVEQIRAARPHVVWCALGAPKQELWMREVADEIAPAVLVGVGAAFDFLAGAKPRAPLVMQRAGLEWLHRLCNEPTRLAGRYFSTNAQFVALVSSRSLHRLVSKILNQWRNALSTPGRSG